MQRIVVAEDEGIFMEQLMAHFGVEGYSVHPVSEGGAALALVEELGGLDVLVTDIQMPPGMYGDDLINELGRRGYDFPIIVYACDFSPDKASYPGKIEFIDKTEPSSAVVERVRELIGDPE